MEILWNTSGPRARSKLVTASGTALYRLSAPTPSTGRSITSAILKRASQPCTSYCRLCGLERRVIFLRSVAAVKRSPAPVLDLKVALHLD